LKQAKSTTDATLHAVARLLFYALFGADAPSTVAGLRLPAMPMWLRVVDDGPFATEVARALVITARIDGDPSKPTVPSTYLRSPTYRIRPADSRDWGLDPVHTPEGEDIRLTGRLGAGVTIAGRKLAAPDPTRPALSVSTSRVPFAGYDDPRRLLMAANMQAHAMDLPGSEPPRVRTDDRSADPPGVNLRVAYLAWQGSNHEDAWVLSESAAARLRTTERVVTTAAIRAVELAPEVLVKEGERVARGQPLLRRYASPVLVVTAIKALAVLPDLEGVELPPEVDDAAPVAGKVVEIEEWDLVKGEGLPSGWEVPEAVRGAYRAVYRFHVERDLPLEVGDKLANRHGHKGVVGAILPDDDMPIWRDEPLEALIDPISVLNRSNWGQVHEALLGAAVEPGQSRDVTGLTAEAVIEEARSLGADERGRWPTSLPPAAGGETKEVRAVAGVQFVMRMPHHARDRLSGSPAPRRHLGEVRNKAQRLGEPEHWALWAHGGGGAAPAPGQAASLSPAAARLGRLLAAAGYEMKAEGDEVVVRRLALSEAPPPGWKVLSVVKEADDGDGEQAANKPKMGKAKKAAAPGDARPQPQEGKQPRAKALRSLPDLFDALDAVTPDSRTALVFDPPLSPPPRAEPADESGPPRQPQELRWLPVLPACDRPDRRLFDGSTEPHELTLALRRVVRLLRGRLRGGEQEGDATDLYYAARRCLSDAYAAAVGRSATGQFSGKRSLLRRGVLGRRLSRSARATVSPGGPLGLALDEIGLPPPLAHVLFGPGLPADAGKLAEEVEGRRVWLKRDPVLHRYGLLPVRVRVVAGDTIRLPASLLGPMGADFDGDTVAVFAQLPGAPADLGPCSPPALALHPILGASMFEPGKQYRHGLHLLADDAGRLARLQEDLAAAGAPPWPGRPDVPVKKAFQLWVEKAVASPGGADGAWWAVLERHALAAIADDPGLGFGLADVGGLVGSAAVACGAAKDLYGGPGRQAVADLLAGRSLSLYHKGEGRGDPIADVMVAAKATIGMFGGASRRLIYSAEKLRPEDVQQAQALTEQVTQTALSIKAGKAPLSYADFERQLKLLLRGEYANEHEVAALLDEVGRREKFEPIWEHLRGLMPERAPAWLEWLRKTHELKDLIVPPKHEVRLPLSDLRLRCWLAEG
jgi:hypothetical protein